MRGKYVSIDPREWKNNYDVSISVGLGTGNKDQQMAMSAMVLQKQEQILGTQGFSNPLVTVGQYRNTLGRFIEAAGYKDSNEFFKEITPEMDAQLSAPPPPQQTPTRSPPRQRMQCGPPGRSAPRRRPKPRRAPLHTNKQTNRLLRRCHGLSVSAYASIGKAQPRGRSTQSTLECPPVYRQSPTACLWA